LGQLFGYGGNGTSAATQLATQGVAGPATPNLGQEQAAVVPQTQLLNTLIQRASGTGPSAAQGTLSQAIQSAMNAQGAAASGGRYGQNAQTRQSQVARNASSIEAGGANAAGNLRANEMNAAAGEAAGTAGQLAGEGLQAAGLGEQGQLAYNQQVGNLYGAEQGQQAQAGQQLQGAALGALGGAAKGGSNALGLAAMEKGGVSGEDHHMTGMKHLAEAIKHFHMAHGGHIDMGNEVLTGEKGPELLASTDPHQKPALITHPSLLHLGEKGKDVVLPLKKGSAPYHPSATAEPEARPTAPAPKHPEVKEEAKKALDGKGKVHSPGPGAKGLSPKTKPVVKKAMKAGGINPQALAHYRMARAHEHATEK
jgi:hypothetical protein